jgi:hypothetical protein
MITASAADVERAIADDLTFVRMMLSQFDLLLSSTAPCSKRDRLIAANERLEIFFHGLPERIAEHGPFADQQAIIDAAQTEVGRALSMLNASGAILRTIGTA